MATDEYGEAITAERWSHLLATRARQPEAIHRAYRQRSTRPLLNRSGRLLIVAADHPARGALRAGERATAMADRRSLLGRLSVALDHPGVDGILATPDIVEDLLLLGRLEERLIFGSMNRGGLAGAAWELDDPLTAYTAAAVRDRGLDGGKLLVRMDDSDPGTRATLAMAAEAVTSLAAAERLAMVEPLPYRRDGNGRSVLDPDPDRLVRAVAIASGLGATSAYTWLKLPAGAGSARVLGATSLPCLLLGGDTRGEQATTFADWQEALALPNAMGLVAGRTLLYPPDDDVRAAVGAAAHLVHGRTT